MNWRGAGEITELGYVSRLERGPFVFRARALQRSDPSIAALDEFVFLKAMPDAPQANVVAALLVFRFLYLILPLMFALLVVLGYERNRWRAPAAIRGIDPDGPGNPDQ